MDGDALLRRIIGILKRPEHVQTTDFLRSEGKKLRLVRNSSGEPVGRASIYAEGMRERIHKTDQPENTRPGAVTVGGLRCCAMNSIMGLFTGKPVMINRSAAEPIVEEACLAHWASEQAEIIKGTGMDPGRLYVHATIIRSLGGAIGELPICKTAKGWSNSSRLAEICLHLPAVKLTIFEHMIREGRRLDPLLTTFPDKFELDDDVVLAAPGSAVIIAVGQRPFGFTWPRSKRASDAWLSARGFPDSMFGAVVEELAQAWGTCVTDVLKASGYSAIETPDWCQSRIGVFRDQVVRAPVIFLRKPGT